jgi:transposase
MQVRDAPRKFAAEVREEIAQVALSPPRQLIGLTQWSLSKLREYLIQQQIVGDISLEWLRQILRRLGVRWRRTKTWKESNDPDFWPKLRRIRRLYAACPADGRRICVDEFGPLNLQPRAGHCLAGRGKRLDRHRATYHRSGGVRHFLAAYDLETDRLFGIFSDHKTGRDFLKFLKWLRRRYPIGQRLHIVLDNYRTHLTHAVLAWAKQHRVVFYYTPTDASWLNRIECQLTELKKFTLDNSDYRTHDEQQQAINSYLSWRNRHRLLAVTPWQKYKRARRAA